MRFLVVEDNRDVAHAIGKRLGEEGHVIEIANSLADARAYLAVGKFDLIVLDVNLPDGVGFTLLENIRAANDTTPILVLTARPDIDDKIDALDLGADDYVVKPFDFEELVARIRAITRRAQSDGQTQLMLGNLTYWPAMNKAEIEGQALELTRAETRLLEMLMAQKGRVLEKGQLLDRLYALDQDVSPNALELTISRLRKKLSHSDVEIRTLRGLGYQMIATPR